ncbi:mucin-2-like [Dunckerocampus dactyliophorus]|uniref:mucin-2-like n=1 Tax=Dunckerocampus dactyliophorus TaxID=161453 RepID=UPI0024072BFF|nr:mucin-2-like [Dunckerocampus dactyliophorus]
MGNTQVEVELQFNDSVSAEQIPEADVVVDTLVQAVNSPNNTFNLSIDPDSIAVIPEQPTTTDRPTTPGPTTTNGTGTTRGPTTALTSVPSPIVSVEAILEEPFVEEFNDPNSEQYQTLQTQVVSMCDFIFFQAFGNIFIRTIVIEFRPQMGNTQVEVELQFNDSVSTDQIPEADVVVDTLVQAVNSPNNTFNLSIDPDSIAVIPEQPGTTTHRPPTHGPTTTNGPMTTRGPTTAVTLVPSPVVSLEAILEEPFVPEFNDPNSEQYQTLQTQVVSMCDFIFFQAFENIFIRTIVIGFRPQMGNTQVEVELQFNNSVSTDQIPEADVVVDTLVQAVNSPNNTFNLTIDPDSIAVIPEQPRTTTHRPTTRRPTTTNRSMTTRGPTASVTSVPSAVVSVEAILEEPFVLEFNDPNSEQYQTLQKQVVSMCDFIFFEAFGNIFIRTIVIGFRPQMGNTQVEVELEFNASVSTDQIPEADVVVDTLVQAVNSPNNTFNLTIDPDSIAVIPEQPKTTTNRPITHGPTTTPVSTTHGPATTLVSTHGSTTTTRSMTTHGPTTLVTSITSPVVSVEAIVEEPFVPEFNDPNSEQYQTLQSQVVSMCDFIFLEAFGSIFNRTIVIGFRPQMGNTQVEVELQFNNSVSSDQIPEADVVVDTLVQAVNNPNNTFNLTIDPDSIAVISKKPTTTTHGPITIHGPTTHGPETTQVPITHGPTTTRVPTTRGPTTTQAITTNGLTNTNVQKTTHRPSTSVPSVLSPVLSVEATVEEPFVAEFNDPTSEQYQTLQTQVVSMCDFIFLEAFGSIFIRTTVIGFRPQMGNTQVEVELQFNNSVSRDQIPEADVVVDTLVQAVNNPNNTFNLTIDPDSIAVISEQPKPTTNRPIIHGPTTTPVPTTHGPATTLVSTHGSTSTTRSMTTHGPTTSVTSITSPIVFVEAIVEEPFVPEFNDPNSEQYQTLQSQVVSICDFIFLEAFGSIFIRTTVIGFRPQMGNTQVEVELQFNNSVSSDQIPEADVVVDTLVQAVNNPNNTFNLTIDPDSIAVISEKPTTTTHGPITIQRPTTHGPTTTHIPTTHRPTTTHGPTTTQIPTTHGPTTTHMSTTHGPTTSPPPVVILSATLEEPFVEEFNDVNSAQYKALETQVVTACDIIYRARFGLIFIRTFLIRIIRAVVVTRMDKTEVEVGLQFMDTESTPQNDLVVSTLQETLSQPNNTFNISIVANSIQVIQSPHKANSTTAKPASTTKKATTPLQFTTRTLRFTSVGETFTSNLLNQSSAAFIARATMIKTTLEPFYSSAFSSFNSLIVTSFSNGSIINNMVLRFTSGSVPNNTAIGKVLIDAVPNITAFNVDITSIFVNGMQVSSGVCHKTSIITASCLALLSWLLSSQY